jgi:hypothetical protein
MGFRVLGSQVTLAEAVKEKGEKIKENKISERIVRLIEFLYDIFVIFG